MCLRIWSVQVSTCVSDYLHCFQNKEVIFENLKTDCDADCMKFEMDALEEKCYAIRGRRGVQAKMNFSQKAPKLPIETPENNKADQPYGGLFEEYGFSAKE